jgi:uncharacterized membrane protein
MLRNLLLFFSALLLVLTAGRAFWVWLGENLFNMSGQTYLEFCQQLDTRIAVPIAVTGLGGTLLAGISAVFYRSDRRMFYLLLLACGLAVIGDWVTKFVNVPINNRLATWNPAALPPNYQYYLRQWWQWHHVRLDACSWQRVWCLVRCSCASSGSRRPRSQRRKERLSWRNI